MNASKSRHVLASSILALCLVPWGSAQDRTGAEATEIEATNAASAQREGSALGQSGTGSGASPRAAVSVPETSDPRDSAFWVPANYLSSGARRPVLQGQQPLRQIELPAGELPWSFQWWPTAQAHLAFRDSAEQSPLEKYDSYYGSLVARSSDAAAVVRAVPKTAQWEANPDNRHNTAQVRTQGGQVERSWKQVGGEVSGITLTNGTAEPGRGFWVDGREVNIEARQVESWQGIPIECFYYRSSVRQDLWNRVVRVPASHHPDQSRVSWWHIYWYSQGGQIRQYGYAGAQVVPGQGGGAASMKLRFRNRDYDVVKSVQQWEGYPIDVYYYRADPPPAGAPPIPETHEGVAWNRFVLVPSQGSGNVPSQGAKWYHVRWEYTEREAGMQWEGHCMGFAAAAILFKEPPASKTVRIDGAKITKVRLKARKAEEAYAGNLEYEAAGQADALRFDNRDLKGLATVLASAFETSFNYPNRDAPYSWADFGTAVGRGNTSQAAYDDIKPHHMHRIMIDFLKERRRSVAIDLSREDSVYNAPVFYYDYQIQGYSTNPRPHYQITAVLGYAGYGNSDAQRGTEKSYWRMNFRIYLDGQNRVIDSEWLGESKDYHPDFVWVPVRLDRAAVRLDRKSVV